MSNNYIIGRNAITEALRSNVPITKIYVSFRSQGATINAIYKLAAEKKIPIVKYDTKKFNDLENKVSPNQKMSQGVIALREIVDTIEFEDILEMAYGRSEQPILIALDGIEDPHNLGAIARTAEAAGASGIIFSDRGAAQITPAAIKASTGALEIIPVSRVSKLSDALEVAKIQNWKVIGAEMKGSGNYTDKIYDGPIILLIGSEARGISPECTALCDKIIKIPMKGKMESLNASVSTGIILFEINRQRDIK